jgi:hypothetical protein
MSATDPAAENQFWTERIRQILLRYSEPLLRQVAGKLLKPRNQWPVDELIDRSLETLNNPPVIDRRLKELPVSSRKLLALIGLSRQPIWSVGQLVSMLVVLDHSEGLIPVQTLLEAGLLFPNLPETTPSLKQFEDWLGSGGILQARVLAPPAVVARATGEDLGLPALKAEAISVRSLAVADGLEWPLRMALVWQMLLGDPARLTMQQSLFKRDLTRMQNDPLLSAPFAEHHVEVPEAGVLAVELAKAVGLLELGENELKAGAFPKMWDAGLRPTLIALWSALFRIQHWDPVQGYEVTESESPFPSAALPAFLLLAQLPEGKWTTAQPVGEFVLQRHPGLSAEHSKHTNLAEQWITTLFLGIAYPARLVEAAKHDGQWWFRLGDLGRHLLQRGPAPELSHNFQQTMIVQPNGEMIVYRQGLTPALIGKLSRFATWKTLGAACTLEVSADSVYRGLETGLSLADIIQTLQQHSTRSLPATVLDSLQRWSNKRERITIFSAATLMEFTSPVDLETAFTRGLVSLKLTDRIGLVGDGQEIEFRNFRLIGNRDYDARPQQCVQFEADGLTFNVDAVSSDLLLEAELARIAMLVQESSSGQRRFALTPESLRNAHSQGITITDLEQWCLDRSGQLISSAARLLFNGSGGQVGHFGSKLVIQLPTESVTDGVVQWPKTARYVENRLGPTALVIAEPNFPAFRAELLGIGVELKDFENLAE